MDKPICHAGVLYRVFQQASKQVLIVVPCSSNGRSSRNHEGGDRQELYQATFRRDPMSFCACPENESVSAGCELARLRRAGPQKDLLPTTKDELFASFTMGA